MKSGFFARRIEKLIDLINDSPFDLIAINAGNNLKYFSGMHFHVSERPAVLLVSKNKIPAFICPEFEKEKINNTEIELKQFFYTEIPTEWEKTFTEACAYCDGRNAIIGIEPTSMRFLEIDLLRQTSEGMQFHSAAEILKKLRMTKDSSEIEAMKKAIRIAEAALEKTIPSITIGKTEKEIANELVVNLLYAGSESDLPFSPIIASGPNSAKPHHTPSGREIQEGDFLIIDWGARHDGYISDITRTFTIGKVDDALLEIYEIVRKANKTAREVPTRDLISEEIDSAARNIITKAGYGDFFTHRTGHGIGLEAHEEPYIAPKNKTRIAAGMTFTIEPGIYLPGKGGVRIEDDMVANEERLESLTNIDRNLRLL